MSEPIVSTRTYVYTFVTLMVLTGLTAGAANIDMGAINTLVALLIAICKASLVVLFFMHVRRSRLLVKLVVAGGLVWFLIMIGMILTDYMSRGWLPTPRGL